MLNDVFLAPFLGDDENLHVVGGLDPGSSPSCARARVGLHTVVEGTLSLPHSSQ